MTLRKRTGIELTWGPFTRNKGFNPTCAAVRVWYIMSPVGTRGLTWAGSAVKHAMSLLQSTLGVALGVLS